MARPFFVFSLPQSKSAWIGAFLTYKDWVCLHNVSLAMQGVSDLDKLMALPKRGFADDSLAMIWADIVDREPSARLVTVRKPLAEVKAEMETLGWDVNPVALQRTELALNEVESLSGVLSLQAKDLGDEATAKRLFEFCLPFPFDKSWWEYISQFDIEQNQQEVAAFARVNAKGYESTFAHAASYLDRRLKERPSA